MSKSEPFARLAMRVMNREVSLAVGERLAAQPEVAESFWPGDILAMSEYHRELARAGDPRTALMVQRLLYAAIKGNPGGPRMATGSDFVHQMWTVVGTDLLKIIHYEITRLPDGRLLRLACKAGDTVLPHARQAIGTEPAGLLMREIGTLHLDPYLDPRGPKGQPLDDPRQHWLERLRDERGDELVLVPVADLEMPTPVDALGTAAHYLRDAIPLLDGHPRGTALKALAQALIVLDHRGENIDRAEFLDTANEAIRLIDPARAPQYIIDLRRWLEQDGWQHAGLEASPDELARRLGRVGARARVLQWLRTADAADSGRLLQVATEAADLFADADEPKREELWRITVSAIAKMGPPLDVGHDASLKARTGEINLSLAVGRFTVDQAAAGLVALAIDANSGDREKEGAAILYAAIELDAPLLVAHRDALTWLGSLLWAGIASNAVNADAYGEAVAAYVQAIIRELALGLHDRALHRLRGVLDLAQRSKVPLTGYLLNSLAKRVLWIEASPGTTGARGEEMLQTIFRAAIGLHIKQGQSSVPLEELEELVALFQCFKARRFDTLLRAGAVRLPPPDERGLELLDRVAAAERELPAEDRLLAPWGQDQAFDEDTFLAAYSRLRDDRSPGQDGSERLHNLQNSFEAYFQRRLLETVRDGITEAPSPWAKADLQSRLGERTVLVQQALARTSDGLMAIATLLLTREEVAFGGICTDINHAWTMLEQDDVRVRLHPAGLLVARARRDLREGWTPREPVSEAVRTRLDAHSYLGPIGGALKSLRERGKDHLCIVPHGPMHFLPYHLLEVDGRPLADDWIVTYLPSVGLLMRDPAEPGARPGTGTREGAAVFGIGYGSDYPFELPELSESLAEAEAVAAVYGVEPKLDCDATEQAVRHGLEHARVIHLSAHGRHNVAAPGFQTLYLWPTDGDDGRLMAHEIATLDLAGVNLVTLSACETALGRFDFSDNLRGLPATLLLGGASTIVGTLWNVSPEVSTAFFREFHARAAGTGPLLDAFAAGQRAARAIDGHYLEWGAFYLSGGW